MENKKIYIGAGISIGVIGLFFGLYKAYKNWKLKKLVNDVLNDESVHNKDKLDEHEHQHENKVNVPENTNNTDKSDKTDNSNTANIDKKAENSQNVQNNSAIPQLISFEQFKKVFKLITHTTIDGLMQMFRYCEQHPDGQAPMFKVQSKSFYLLTFSFERY